MIDPLLQTVLAGSLALLFAAAARHKWRDLGDFAARLGAYRLLPRPLVSAAAPGLALLETVLAVTLLVPAARRGAGVAACLLLALYGGAIAVNLRRGRSRIDCGCSAGPQFLSPWMLLRNGLLVLAAGLVVLPPAARSLDVIDLLAGLLGLVLLAGLYLAGEYLLARDGARRDWERAED